jgi:hypothetical protein
MIYNLVMMCGSGYVPTPPEPPEWNVAAASYVASGLVDRGCYVLVVCSLSQMEQRLYVCGYDQDWVLAGIHLAQLGILPPSLMPRVKDISVYDTQPIGYLY